jgi:DNA-binding transcriptional LysR family regulator
MPRLRDAAVSGHGIALLPTFIAYQELRSGSLKAILSTYHAPELAACVVYPPMRHMKLRVLIDFLVERFGGEPHWDVDLG